MNIELKITEDGSSTLFVPELNEHYHSTHGAIQESNHVFIEAGLNQIKKDSIRIFEMGLGTGLNCLLTLISTEKKYIEYLGIETNPLPTATIECLNYPAILKLTDEQSEQFRSIHQSEWDAEIPLRSNFVFKKKLIDIAECKPTQKFDLIYFDAFAPDVQPMLWTESIFKNMFEMLDIDGVLVTYCAKGSVRRIMKASGFTVERIPGPPGKREMLRATKS